MRSRVRLLPLLAAGCAGLVGMAAPVGAQSAGPVATNGVGTAFELAFWQSVGASADPSLYQAYLEQYPTGTFAALARAKIAGMRRAEPVVVPVAPVAPVAPVPVPAAVAVAPPVAPAPTPVAAAPEPAMRMIPAMIAPFPVPATPAPPPAGSVIGNAALLAALAQSQIGGEAPVASATALPAPPVLMPVPTIAVPERFCSAEARNQFHDTVYKPAMTLAAANNAATIRYLQTLDAQYRASGAQRDAAGMNAVAAGSKAYQPVAGAAFATSNVYLKLFDRIMATPIARCRAS
ncbi:hypothetical protein [Sphingomonas sp. BAUL-RG-20F-R05-02]|uniref:hypothetical protein n=1 Tax=Sphingomonas sp. BAUL-RG-20F-R05-02 TaxID=2914830 RepID=UPI001F59E550|nr:hypothetical protein [Sphingomonas sp. BAUL-RG-20F-R05-02]